MSLAGQKSSSFPWLCPAAEASVRNKRGVADENLLVDIERKALYVLQHWEEMPGYGYKLVPEHVEIQSLYNPENPGLVQVRCISMPNLNIVSGKDLLDSWFLANCLVSCESYTLAPSWGDWSCVCGWLAQL